MSEPTATPRAVVEAYVTGTRTRDVSLLRQIFHESAVMTGWFGDALGTSGPEPFFDELDANDVSDAYTATIVTLDQTDRIATAEVAETNLLGKSFTNHFHLIQVQDGGWRIISKLYRHY